MGTGKGTERTGCAEGTGLARSEGWPEEAERTRGPLLLGPCFLSACAVPHGLSPLPLYSHHTGKAGQLAALGSSADVQGQTTKGRVIRNRGIWLCSGAPRGGQQLLAHRTAGAGATPASRAGIASAFMEPAVQ